MNAPGPPGPPAQARILIVDDDAGSRASLRALLQREPYELLLAESGARALELLQKETPSTILTDLMMPGMSGVDLCRELRRDDRWRHIPVLLITSLEGPNYTALALEAGADDFLSKPVNGVELRARVRAMLRIRRQYEQLRETSRLREDLSRMIVHDMRTPLNVIGLDAHAILATAQQPGVLEAAGAIQQQAAALSALMDDLLVMAKIEDGRFTPQLAAEDPVALTEAAAAGYQTLARPRRIDVQLDLPPRGQTVLLDASLYRRVLDNLVSNAIKFSPAGGQVRVWLQCGEGTVPRLRLRVGDQGPGVPAELRDRIFQKFEVVDAKRRGFAGVGLGLAFCRLVAEAHQGQIRVDPNTPQGSIFTFEL